ncbi:MAG TPA: NAD(P)H-dependent glycerol-3-phosphate dehydrogenase, partial [Pyrinomonadaceae bacterium]|nr:NAD(P)H-dependent glycerol-3-phosphate dehydrogenase [Pyrinomonadaceae bacterium]
SYLSPVTRHLSPMKIAVIGAGAWGTALSLLAGRAGHEVRLWSRSAGVVAEVNGGRTNSSYLAGYELPESVRATEDLSAAVEGAEVVLLAAPSHALRELLTRMRGGARREMIFVSAAKGIEVDTGMRVSEVVSEVLGGVDFAPRFVCLSGPSFAREVAAGQPTAVVASAREAESREEVQRALSGPAFRVYTNDDVAGTELGGAVKNVLAIAAGMVSGLGLGTNSVAALVTRGLAEMTRLGLVQGARVETLMGLAGLGDLVLTCTGSLSRNRYVGQELGRGRALPEVLAGMNEVAEGVRTTRAVRRLAERSGVEMPITSEVYAVLYEGKSPREAVAELMSRPPRGEFEGIQT